MSDRNRKKRRKYTSTEQYWFLCLKETTRIKSLYYVARVINQCIAYFDCFEDFAHLFVACMQLYRDCLRLADYISTRTRRILKRLRSKKTRTCIRFAVSSLLVINEAESKSVFSLIMYKRCWVQSYPWIVKLYAF